MQRFVPQKENKAVWDNGPSLYADQMHVWLYTRDGRLKAGPLKGKYFHQKYLFFSLNLWWKDLVPPPKKKKTVSDSGLSYTLIGCLTLYKRWET